VGSAMEYWLGWDHLFCGINNIASTCCLHTLPHLSFLAALKRKQQTYCRKTALVLSISTLLNAAGAQHRQLARSGSRPYSSARWRQAVDGGAGGSDGNRTA